MRLANRLFESFAFRWHSRGYHLLVGTKRTGSCETQSLRPRVALFLRKTRRVVERPLDPCVRPRCEQSCSDRRRSIGASYTAISPSSHRSERLTGLTSDARLRRCK